MKKKILAVLQAALLLFAMGAATGCYVGPGWGGGWHHGWHHHYWR